MEVRRGEFSKFCPGIEFAWNKTIESAKQKKVKLLGELLHNKQAMQELKELGVEVVDSTAEINPGDTVILRAHGEDPLVYEDIKERKAIIIDATCNRVLQLQKKAEFLEQEGYQVLLCGKKGHPEVKGVIGHTKKGIVVQDIEEIEKLNFKGKVVLISQTTFSLNRFNKIARFLKEKTNIDLKIINTICPFTQSAQKEAGEIAKKVDCLIVVGGKHSSNTIRLREVGEKFCPTYHIETAEELDKAWFTNKKIVGLVSGASTPSNIVSQVEKRLQVL